MSAAQKQAQANFKKAIAYRKKTGCSLKEAFAHVKGNKVTGIKKSATKKKVVKKSVVKNTHKDTKSHNVNIKVVSGVISFNKKNLDKTQSYYTYKGKKYEIREDQDGENYISVAGKIMYLKMPKVNGWKKGSTYFREKDEGKVKAAKNVKVSRVPKGSLYKAGTFAKFSKLAGMFDISAINDLDQLKKQYFRLVKIYHPDAGGTNEQFVQLKNEYDKLRDAILRGANLTDEQKKNEVEIDEYTGYCYTLGECFEQIIIFRTLNAQKYYGGTE
jgi:hypothetical protein